MAIKRESEAELTPLIIASSGSVSSRGGSGALMSEKKSQINGANDPIWERAA